jgi:hypothetical protein
MHYTVEISKKEYPSEDNKGLIRSLKSNKNRKQNGQKDKQSSTKHRKLKIKQHELQ